MLSLIGSREAAVFIARLLVDAVADRARNLGCRELASDMPIDNAASQAMHRAIGFTETERVVFFSRPV